MASRTVAGGPSEASDHRKTHTSGKPTPAGSRNQIPSGVNPFRDRCRGRIPTRAVTGGRSLRSDHRLPYVTPAGVVTRLRRRNRRASAAVFGHALLRDHQLHAPVLLTSGRRLV